MSNIVFSIGKERGMAAVSTQKKMEECLIGPF